MEVPDDLACLYSAEIEQARSGAYYIEVPEDEIDLGDLETGGVCRVAILTTEEQSGPKSVDHPDREPEPPVEQGEIRELEIESVGDQGDGIAKVERGFVIIVPDAKTGERVTAEITDVQKNVAFAEVQEFQTRADQPRQFD